MGKLIKSCLNGLLLGAKSWVLFGLLVPIIFFIFHPVDPMVVFGVSVMAVIIYYSNKWKKEMPAAKQATEEAEKAGVKFVEVHPTDEDKESPLKRYKNKFYPMLWSGILSACMLSCSYQMIHSTTTRNERARARAAHAISPESAEKTGRTVALAEQDTCTIWNADNIEMVHLQDASQYVTNSDSILSPQTVDAINLVLKDLDSIAGVKSAMVICHYLDEGGSYRAAVDLMNKYAIGNKDTGRGVCVVVAYDQHQYTITPSRDMESELTDMECAQLGRTYLQPFLKNEQPDSAMLHLAQAIYETVSAKQESGDDLMGFTSISKKGIFSGESGFNMLICLILCLLYGYFNEKNKWNKPSKELAQAMATPPEKTHDDEVEPEKLKQETHENTPPPVNRGSYGGGSSSGGGATGTW